MSKLTNEAFVIEKFFQIETKDAEVVDFNINQAQSLLDGMVLEQIENNKPVRLIIPKFRQGGVSSYILARFVVKCATQKNIKAKIIAHDSDSTRELFRKAKFLIDNMKAGIAPKLKYDNKNEVVFERTNSVLSVYTAGNEESGRGGTFHLLHCSEIAFWPNPRKIIKSLFQTVSSVGGEIFIESTGNGSGTWYHKRCRAAKEKRGSEDLLFLSYLDFDEYNLHDEELAKRIQEKPNRDIEEHLLLEQNIPLPKIAWRRKKLEEFDMVLEDFKQEYPSTLDEAFQSSDRSFFHRVTYLPHSERWVEHSKNLYVLEGHPISSMNYSLGADPSGGVGQDNATIEVLCAETGEQVAEYSCPWIAPNDFAVKIEEVGEIFGFPIAVVESNNHGVTTLDNLQSNNVYPKSKIFWDEHSSNIIKSGFRTTSLTKPLWMGKLRKSLADDLKIYSEELRGELACFNGELKASSGEHDDLVMALMLANVGLLEVWKYASSMKAVKKSQFVSPTSYDAIFGRRRYGSGQPVKRRSANSSVLDYSGGRGKTSIFKR